MLHSTSCIIQTAMLSPIALSSLIAWYLSGMPLFPLPSCHMPTWLSPHVPLVNLRIISPEKPSLTSLNPTLHNKCRLPFPGLIQHCVLTSVTVSEQKASQKASVFVFPHLTPRASLVAHIVKNLPAMQEMEDGKISWRTRWLSTPVFLPEESHTEEPWGYSPWVRKES